MGRTRTPVAVSLALLTAVGVTACGGDDGGDDGGTSGKPFKGQNADSIAAKAVAATKAAPSVRLSGTERQQGGQSMKVDFHVDRNNACTGTMTSQGVKADVLRAGTDLYVKGNEDYWRKTFKAQGQSGPKADKLIGKLKGRWVKVPTADKSMQGVCDKDRFLAAMDRDKSEREGMTKGATTEIEGREALALKKRQTGGEEVTMYVATQGKPYILKAESTGGGKPSSTVFSDYGKKVDARKPAAKDVVDPQKLSN
ncbi:hypothetical protein ABT390_22780 [Streptomyces aurantiacus]|uniref:hypothetical protein n=1 Tax=Streptomyces aurantiacus TaxID=47760 RepID=UPI0033242B39